MKKRALAILLSLSMICSMPSLAMAAKTDSDAVSVEILTEQDIADILLEDEEDCVSVDNGEEEVTGEYPVMTAEEVASYVKERMLKRETTITLSLTKPSGTGAEFSEQVRDLLFEHTGKSIEGDYLDRHTRSRKFSYTESGDRLTYVLEFVYRTDQSQENAVTSKLQSVMSSLNLDGKSDYEKCKLIYDYITSHVTYDYEHMYDPDYDLAHTTYGALIDGTAVCEGYALLFYRMALEAGLDCRFVTGRSEQQNHAWNIVKIDGKYYNVDATWDAGKSDYWYFLQGKYDFANHELDASFKTTAFTSQYPMEDYAYSSGDPSKTSGTYGDVTWEYTAREKKLVISGSGKMDEPFVDESTGEMSSSQVPWDRYRHSIQKVEIKKGVTYVSSMAFYNCIDLTSVSLPDSLKEIGVYAFHMCTKLSRVDIPASVKTIGPKAFYGCPNLKEYYFYGSAPQLENDSIDNENTVVVYYDSSSSGWSAVRKQFSKVTFKEWNAPSQDKLAQPKISSLQNAASGITVKWSKSPNASGYYVYRKKASDTKWTMVQKISSGSTVKWTDRNVANGTKYTYTVKAYSKTMTSTYHSGTVIYRMLGTTLSGIKNSQKGQMTVKWKKNSKASGYQIQYADNKSFSKAKTVSAEKSSTVSKVIKGLVKGKTYYVRIRTYKKSGSKKYPSAWSSVKYIKISK